MRSFALAALAVAASVSMAIADGGAPKPKKAKPRPSPSPVSLAAPVEVEPPDVPAPEPLPVFEELPVVEVDMEPPPPLPVSEPGFAVTAILSAQSVMGAGAESSIRPSALLAAEGPIAWRNTTPLRMFARLRLLGLPGEAFDFTSVDTIRAVDASFGSSLRLGRAFIGTQELWTSIVGEWGFSTGLPPDELRTSNGTHHLRHMGVGVLLEERSSGAWLSAIAGRHQAVGTFGWGQLMLAGAVPISVKDRGVFVIGGDAALGIGSPCSEFKPFCRQQDFVSIEVGISVPDLIAVMR